MHVRKSSYGKNEIASFLSEKYRAAIYPAPMTEGQESQAFSFTHENKEYVFRINANMEGFKKDDYAFRNFAAPNIPIPKIVECGRFDDKNAYCVSEKAIGVTYQNADETVIKSMLGEVDGLWRSIGSTDISQTEGYGVFSSESGNAPYKSWNDYLLSIADERLYDWKKVRRAEKVNEKLIDDLFTEFLRYVRYCPEERKLCHGDFGSNNLLVDAGKLKITAIIDWDNAAYGDPLIDVAGAYFWKDWLTCMRMTSSYWDEALGSLPNYRNRIMCYMLRTGLAEIYDNTADGDGDTLAWLHDRCEKFVKDAKRTKGCIK